MPTKAQLHRNMAIDFEFKISARDGFGSEHPDHVPTSSIRQEFSSTKGKVIGQYYKDENGHLRLRGLNAEEIAERDATTTTAPNSDQGMPQP